MLRPEYESVGVCVAVIGLFGTIPLLTSLYVGGSSTTSSPTSSIAPASVCKTNRGAGPYPLAGSPAMAALEDIDVPRLLEYWADLGGEGGFWR